MPLVTCRPRFQNPVCLKEVSKAIDIIILDDKIRISYFLALPIRIVYMRIYTASVLLHATIQITHIISSILTYV